MSRAIDDVVAQVANEGAAWRAFLRAMTVLITIAGCWYLTLIAGLSGMDGMWGNVRGLAVSAAAVALGATPVRYLESRSTRPVVVAVAALPAALVGVLHAARLIFGN
jgi:hypothetical protein